MKYHNIIGRSIVNSIYYETSDYDTVVPNLFSDEFKMTVVRFSLGDVAKMRGSHTYTCSKVRLMYVLQHNHPQFSLVLLCSESRLVTPMRGSLRRASHAHHPSRKCPRSKSFVLTVRTVQSWFRQSSTLLLLPQRS